MNSKKNKVKVGVVGMGIGSTHLNAYRKLSDSVEIYAVCDLNKERAEHAAKEYGVPNIFTDYKEMLALPELDAVSVCTPNFLHAELALASMAAGKHVLCEKPMANTLENAQQIAKAAKEISTIFMMGMNNRFRGDTKVLKALIEAGELGDIYYAKCGWVRRAGIPGLGGWFTTKAMSGGGPLIDLGVHMLDMTMYLMGNPAPVSVSGSTYAHFGPRGLGSSNYGYKPDPSTPLKYDVEDLATGLIKFDNGATLFVEASWASHIAHEKNYSILMGTEGGAQLDPFQVYKDMGGVPVDIAPHAPQINGHEAEIKHFIECIQTGTQPIATAEQGLHILQILDAIYRSAETGREVLI